MKNPSIKSEEKTLPARVYKFQVSMAIIQHQSKKTMIIYYTLSYTPVEWIGLFRQFEKTKTNKKAT